MTVSWRRSAVSRAPSAGEGLRDTVARATSSGAADEGFGSSIADRILRRWPTAATPRSFRSSTVSFGSIAPSISLSRNAASYCPRPRLRSQSPTSIVAPAYGLNSTMVPERPRVSRKSAAGRCGGRVWPVSTPFGTDHYLRGTAAHERIPAEDRSRRQPDIADRGRGRRSWAESVPRDVASGLESAPYPSFRSERE